MGQLVKLQDYISRYESGIYKYPSRFIRLKRRQWEQMKRSWEAQNEPEIIEEFEKVQWDEKREKKKIFTKLTGWLHRNADSDSDSEEILFRTEEQSSFIPQSIDQLKKHFLDEIFHVQILWASSTLTERSYVDSSFYKEEQLKFLLQRLPDTFLLFYRPLFLLKKAPVEGESIILTPTEVYVLLFLEEEKDAVFVEGGGRFWEKRIQKQKKKLVNPMIRLNRTETIIRSIFQADAIDLPIKKLIVSRNGYIDFPSVPFGVTIVDQRNFHEWLQKAQSFSSPIKHMQLKAAQSIFQYCKTNAIPRVD
ncbi:NERD domain-containing protein [Fervidibacillus albus]|uniref:NERD domain-containing protein n=1 Tax=Fervidibacillus albus TaxID=2980026 RepID=A0A9E8RW99_9BACI|nr:NERD domain-containing protein [Fervidibacillus albus]WAA10079.1 NERD domain-containing protein [Fervidibacillus albus]